MSEFKVQCVKLEKFGKHPNADSLSIISVAGRPVIFKTEDFPVGSLAVHIPPDAICDVEREEFSWLSNAKTKHRVKFIKLRGVPSYGFFVPAPEGAVPGQDFQAHFGIEKFEPELPKDAQGDRIEGPLLPYHDIESLHKYRSVLEGNVVCVTEKIHGQQGKWVREGDTVHASSRNHFRRDSVWNRMAEKYELSRLPEGIAIFGEVYGPGCQDLHYGVTEPTVAFFDALDMKTGIYLAVKEFRDLCEELALPMAPVLYEGTFDAEEFYKLSEGASTLHMQNYSKANPGNAGVFHVTEGIVVKPFLETWTVDIGRVVLKLVGEGFLLRKGG